MIKKFHVCLSHHSRFGHSCLSFFLLAFVLSLFLLCPRIRYFVPGIQYIWHWALKGSKLSLLELLLWGKELKPHHHELNRGGYSVLFHVFFSSKTSWEQRKKIFCFRFENNTQKTNTASELVEKINWRNLIDKKLMYQATALRSSETCFLRLCQFLIK